MATQTTTSILVQHSASLKQVKWQPGAANNSVIATSSRDGSIQIWDLRCRGSEGPAHNIHVPLDPTVQSSARSTTAATTYASVINKIQNAHRPILQSRTSRNDIARDGPLRNDVERVGDVSVTSISFLPQGQEHLLLSASEANATVKLWDIRSLQSSRRKTSSPLSSTQQPQSHSQWRHFGISSINLSSDGSRLYTLCKDNSVYAYSMAHLILGRAPELSITNAPRRCPVGESRNGLGPLYAFRHPQLHVTSFYVKSSIRPPKNGQAEILAVGSSDGCTVLFPTDERHHWQQQTSTPSDLERTIVDGRRRLPGSAAEVHGGTSPKDDNIPIIQSGTPLIRGHDREVGALTWTSEGALVTVGDDFIVRCWREGDRARDLRTGGEEGGRRWGCGWAAMPDSYDEDFE
jgi:WD40 repeat protein